MQTKATHDQNRIQLKSKTNMKKVYIVIKEIKSNNIKLKRSIRHLWNLVSILHHLEKSYPNSTKPSANLAHQNEFKNNMYLEEINVTEICKIIKGLIVKDSQGIHEQNNFPFKKRILLFANE